ncbi:MAG TPA: hypothetical protein PKN48_16365, partial [Bacteroidales bacterium]|nr:hypothetical protein [Bacteroidales bacterium]
MKNHLIILFFLLFSSIAMSQTMYSSKNGIDIPPAIQMRMLNIFINIIYDQTPERDPLLNNKEHPWQAGQANSI